MRQASLTSLPLLALALVTSQAFADPGLTLTWRACAGAGGATATETFTCNNNTTPGGDGISFRLVGSFTPALPMSDFNGLAAIVDVSTSGTALPAWWQLGAGECREGSLTANLGYAAPGLCTSPFATGSLMSSNVAWVTGYLSPNRARLYVDVHSDVPKAIVNNVRYTAFDLRLDAAHTLDDGEPACPDCCVPLCLLFAHVQLFGANGAGEGIGAASPEALAGWNGQATSGTPGGCFVVGGCPTPAARSTWGAIRSVYR